jgi:alkylhydroperoxidase/carboxymuconolactone decarboxylase family protein YurZ
VKGEKSVKRTTLVEYDDASPEVQAVYDEIMTTMGAPGVLNSLKALGNNPIILRGVWTMLKSTLIEGEIPELLKQLILFKISVAVGNEYCTSLHAHAALNLDPTLTYDDLMTLTGGDCSANMPPSFPIAIDIVSRASLEPKSIEDENWDFEEQLRDEGFSESEIDELLAVGYFSVMMNMVVDAYEVPWEAPFPP